MKSVKYIAPKLLLLVLYFIFIHLTYAQQTKLTFQHLSIENGLSSNHINCLLQDDQGFVWIGTNIGLNKFDGYKVKSFYHHENDSNSLASNFITRGFKDNKNRLWFAGDFLIMCKPAEEKLVSFKHNDSFQNSFCKYDPTDITQDENGTIWIGTRKGIYKYNENTNDFNYYLNDSAAGKLFLSERNFINDILPDFKGNIWVGTNNGLYKFSIKSKIFTPVNSILGTPTNAVFSLVFDKKGLLWMSTIDAGLFVIDTLNKKCNKINSDNYSARDASSFVENVSCDKDGNIWLATGFNGISIYNPKTNEWKKYKHDIFDNKSLADDKTQVILQDKSGLFWIGTDRHGVDRVSAISDKFVSYIQQPGKPNSLCENDIGVSVENKQGNIWLGCKNGLIFFDRKNNSFNCFKQGAANTNSISSNIVFSVALDLTDNLWVATENGLNYLNTKTEKWTNFFNNKADSNSLPSNLVFDVFVKKNGEIWGGANGSVFRFNPKSGIFESKYNNAKIKKLESDYYLTVFEDKDKNMWLSKSRNGILHVDNEFNLIRKFCRSGGFNASLVHQFAEDSIGNVWMATNRGLYRWNKKSESFSEFNNPIYHLNGHVNSIVIENNKTVWVSTPKGLKQIVFKNPNEIDYVKSFDISDGLQSNAFNNGAAFTLTTNEFFFGGINGFNIFKPQLFTYNKFIAPIQISNFKVFDNEIPIIYNDGVIDEIILDYKQNFFSFQMLAMSFDHPEKNQFAYQLIGFDNAMIYCGIKNEVSYTNVPPGEYILQILAANNDGLWNNEGIKIKVKIIPPFWKTLWFKTSSFIIICLVIFLFIDLKNKKNKQESLQQNEINKQIAEAKLSALRAQMNPHFIFNSLNSIQHFISESDKGEALKYLSKFSKLIRLVLQNAIRNTNSIEDELKMLGFYLELESLRFSSKFAYRFIIDEKIIKDSTFIPTMLIQPYVENAVIHGLLNKQSKGDLTIEMISFDDKIICKITDNGIGRVASELIQEKKFSNHHSLGMKVTEERMNILEQITKKSAKVKVIDLVDLDGNASGTSVEIEINIEN